MKIPVEISAEALAEVKNIMENKNIPAAYGLRVGVRGGGGCSAAGMNYMLGFDKMKETDKAFEVDGITIFIEKAHFMYIMGLTIDYINDNDKTGFIFETTKSANK